MEKTHFVFAPDLPAAMAWYNALLGHAPEPDSRRTRYRLPHGELVLTTVGRPGQHRLRLDSLDAVRPRLTGVSDRQPETGRPTGYERCHDPAGNTILLVPSVQILLWASGTRLPVVGKYAYQPVINY